MNSSTVEALQRIDQTGGHTETLENPCKNCTSEPACKLVRRKEKANITPGSKICQRIIQIEEHLSR